MSEEEVAVPKGDTASVSVRPSKKPSPSNEPEVKPARGRGGGWVGGWVGVVVRKWSERRAVRRQVGVWLAAGSAGSTGSTHCAPHPPTPAPHTRPSPRLTHGGCGVRGGDDLAGGQNGRALGALRLAAGRHRAAAGQAVAKHVHAGLGLGAAGLGAAGRGGEEAGRGEPGSGGGMQGRVSRPPRLPAPPPPPIQPVHPPFTHLGQAASHGGPGGAIHSAARRRSGGVGALCARLAARLDHGRGRRGRGLVLVVQQGQRHAARTAGRVGSRMVGEGEAVRLVSTARRRAASGGRLHGAERWGQGGRLAGLCVRAKRLTQADFATHPAAGGRSRLHRRARRQLHQPLARTCSREPPGAPPGACRGAPLCERLLASLQGRRGGRGGVGAAQGLGCGGLLLLLARPVPTRAPLRADEGNWVAGKSGRSERLREKSRELAQSSGAQRSGLPSAATNRLPRLAPCLPELPEPLPSA